jgi:hypothetical protein
MSTTWTKIYKGCWITKDGRWTASNRWNSIQHNHWVLLVGGSDGPQIATRPALAEIKEIVAEGRTDSCIAGIERDYSEQLDALRLKLEAAPTDRWLLHIARRIEAEIVITQRNLDRFRQALASQP